MKSLQSGTFHDWSSLRQKDRIGGIAEHRKEFVHSLGIHPSKPNNGRFASRFAKTGYFPEFGVFFLKNKENSDKCPVFAHWLANPPFFGLICLGGVPTHAHFWGCHSVILQAVFPMTPCPHHTAPMLSLLQVQHMKQCSTNVAWL